MSDTTTTPTPIPDVHDMRMRLYECPKPIHECGSCMVLLNQLLATIPADKSSAAYAMWLLSQGYKVNRANWRTPTSYLQLTEHGVFWDGGERCSCAFDNLGSGEWLIYTPPPAVDDDLIRRKCVEYSKHMLTALPTPVPECPRFTPAELQRLKELQ